MPRNPLGRLAAILGLTAALVATSAARARGQVVVAGSGVVAETDLTPVQEQRLLGEYWSVAKRYKLSPERTTVEMTAWTRDRIGKAQSIQFQPESAATRPDYLESKAEWGPATLRLAAMLHTDVGLAALTNRNVAEFEFQVGIADGWLTLADNRQSAVGSLRSRWNVSVAKVLLINGEAGLAERHMMRLNERIPNDPAILLAYGTIKETQATRVSAEVAGGRLDEPALSTKARDAALTSAMALFEKAVALLPSSAESKVRLAHVLLMKGEVARAEPLLVQTLAAPIDAPLKYNASLMLGAIKESRQQFDQAARAYLDAILAVPDGQSAYLALAHVMQRAGQVNEAATVLERMFGRAIVSVTSDPWWTYPVGLTLDLERQFDEYRRDVRK